MIYVYNADCTDFSSNGIGALMPESAIVTEILNGEYELALIHPLDETGKWKRLVEGRILRVPVPAGITPQIDLIQQATTGTEIYRVSTSGSSLRLRSGTGTKHKVLAKYKKGTEIIVLNKTTDSWYEVSCPDGKHGYMSSKYLTYVRTEPDPAVATGEVIKARQLRDQPFRIYRIVPELDKITVYARHIFYDLLDNMIKSCKPSSSAMGASVVYEISNACQTEHDFTFYSDLDSTAENVEFLNINPVEALLGEDGVISKYAGELQRDWFDIFIVKRIGHDKDVQIRQGKNLLGISYDVDLTNVTTRIMPTGEDKDGELLYLPELFIDSPNIDNYIQPKWMHLAVSEAREVVKGDDKKTKAQCYDEMRKAVQEQYDHGCDLPTVTLNVDFINCADTVEYAQFKALQNIYLGDRVRVIAPRIGVEVSMRMTQYSYDCLTKKYTDMTLGTVAESLEGNMITSQQIASGSISGAKLINGSVSSLHLAADSIQSRHIAAESITTEKLAAKVITAEKLAAGAVDVGALSAVTAKISNLTANDIKTDTLAAGLAAFMVLTCGTASFDRATVTHLVAEALSLSYGVGNDVFINNLKVAYAQIVSAVIGNLCIKASDGNYYILDVDSYGNVSATLTTISNGEISAGQINTGRVILETSITAESMNTSNLLATYALINQIDTARIDVDELFARDAFITQLTTNKIIGDKSLTIIAGEMDEAKSAAQTAQSTAAGAKTTAQSAHSAANTAQTTATNAQSAANSAQKAADDAQTAAKNSQSTANAAQSTATNAQSAANSAQKAADDAQTAAKNSQSTANAAQTAANNAQSIANSAQSAAKTAQSTADNAQTAAAKAQAIADAAVPHVEFQRVVRIDTEGLHVGDNQSSGEVLIDSESVNVVMSGQKYSKFAANYVQFGRYQLRKSADGGLVFKLQEG